MICLQLRRLQLLLPFLHDAAVGEVVDAHGLFHPGQGGVGDRLGLGRARLQDVVDRVQIRFPLGSLRPDGGEGLL